MTSTAKLATALLAGLLAVPAVAVAQEDDTNGPKSGYATGTLLDMSHDISQETSDWAGNVLEWRDWVTTFEYDWTDPRLPSRIDSYNHGNEYVLQDHPESERAMHIRGNVVGYGPDGSWEGSFTGLSPDPGLDDLMHGWMVLTGSGGYDGLYAVIYSRDWYDADTMEFHHEAEALIAEGEPPPVPEAPAS